MPLGDLNCTAAARFAARFPLARREQRSNMLGFARWNQPLMPIALHNSGQNRLQIKMAKAWAASRERSLDGCQGVAKGVSTADTCFFIAVLPSVR